ncbi:MAG: alpha/beta hydrolase [Pleurocapsa sp.]
MQKPKKIILNTLLFSFISLNFIGYLSAYFLTNFRLSGEIDIGLPRPTTSKLPTDIGLKYTTHKIEIDRQEWLETWLISSNNSHTQGTIILFHGKGGTKAQLLAQAKVFNSLNYDTVLVDFRGAGGSSGNNTTVGVREAEDVAIAFNYVQQKNTQRPIILYGISMGSAAILRAIAEDKIQPNGIILELPFARLLTAVRTRLPGSDLFSSPLAELIVFWGGIQHNFNGFDHNPVNFASQVNCPALVFHGKRDRTTSVADVEELTDNLNVPRKLVVFTDAGHELLVKNDFFLWKDNVTQFLNKIS